MLGISHRSLPRIEGYTALGSLGGETWGPPNLARNFQMTEEEYPADTQPPEDQTEDAELSAIDDEDDTDDLEDEDDDIESDEPRSDLT